MPSSHADAALVRAALDLQPLIEREANEIERDCTMTKPVVDALDGAGLFQLGTPGDLGGLEGNVATLAGVCEALAFADGAVGWAFAQNIITAALLSYIDPQTAKSFAVLGPGAGHFAPLGVAHEEDGGFRVSGRWQFASGSGHAKFMGGGCIVYRDGTPAPIDEDGRLPIIGFMCPIEKVVMKGNWDTMGLRGTGSFDYEVPETFVEQGATWYQALGYAPHESGGPIYGLGLQGYGSIGSTAWSLGVASRALHEIAEIAKAGRTRLGSAALRDQDEFQRDFGLHRIAIDGARLQLLSVFESAVDQIESGAPAAECEDTIRDLKGHSAWIVKHVAKPAVQFAWEASGSAGMRNPSRLQRCLRDIQIGAGHQVFDDRTFRDVAKPSLGVEAGLF